MSIKDATLLGIIWLLIVCLWDAMSVSANYAAVLAACANGKPIAVGRTVIDCTPVDVPQPATSPATKRI